jgi:hypothetical protein
VSRTTTTKRIELERLPTFRGDMQPLCIKTDKMAVKNILKHIHLG